MNCAIVTPTLLSDYWQIPWYQRQLAQVLSGRYPLINCASRRGFGLGNLNTNFVLIPNPQLSCCVCVCAPQLCESRRRYHASSILVYVSAPINIKPNIYALSWQQFSQRDFQ
jgi:hypothetical protein